MMGHLNVLKAKFKEILPNIVVIGCTCHSLHLCASYATKKLPSCIEHFVRDIYSYFANSSKRLKELEECQVFAEERPTKLLYPGQTRWLSLRVGKDIRYQYNNFVILDCCNKNFATLVITTTLFSKSFIGGTDTSGNKSSSK